MNLLFNTNLSLPLSNPVLIFTLILFIILFAPILLNKFRIPHLIGLIIAGAIIGPNGLNIMERDSSIILFGTVGLLYIMFLAGLEIDLADFKKNSGKSIVFGLFTFLIPMSLGTLVGIHILGFPLYSAILLASMFASHTLITYPIVSKLGVTKNRAVNIAVGGTMITDTLALLVLAIIVGMSSGDISNGFWLRLSLSMLAFGLLILIGFPYLARWFFKKYDDRISQYIFVLGLVFLGAFLAEAAGIEAIIGAFLAGFSLNRLILNTSALMNRIEFVGNALFIPFFLIGVGMLVDFRSFFMGYEAIFVAIVMTLVATLAKFLAAWAAQKTFKLSTDERRLIFGLSNAQAAATLAAVLVGYNLITGYSESGEPIRLLNENVLNGTILMILFTCTIASFVTQKGAYNIAVSETGDEENIDTELSEKILIPLSNTETIDSLVELSILLKTPKNKTGLYALNIIDEADVSGNEEKKGKKILQRAAVAAASADNHMHELLRYDVNIVNGITSVVRENKISDLVFGIRQKKGISDSFLSNIREGVLTKSNVTTLVYKSAQPLSTIKRHLVIIPERADKEIGFPFWLIRIWNIARNTGTKFAFYGTEQCLSYIRTIHQRHPIDAEFTELSDWEEFLIITRDVRPDDNLMIVLSRRDHPSFNAVMNKIPAYLNKYFKDNSFILIYPIQSGVAAESAFDLKNPSMIDPFRENYGRLDDISRTIGNIFRKK